MGIEPYPWHTAGDVQMFSGCLDSQCSMDAPTMQGLPGGAMTTAMCDILEAHAGHPPGMYPDLMQALQCKLTERGFEQKPRLSSSQPFHPQDKPFSLAEGVVPNMNPQLGQSCVPPPKPMHESLFGFQW